MTGTTAKAILAGGCFWGMEDLIRKHPGVVDTRVGYTGGDVPNATYRNHGSHAEAVEVVFDPAKLAYRELLEFFFQAHDPTTKNRQGNDVGTSYRSAIFYCDEQQRKVAEETIADVDASGLWPGKVVTEVTPAGPLRPSRNTRTTRSEIPGVTRATTSGRTGSFPLATRTRVSARVGVDAPAGKLPTGGSTR
ncbi:peptide-methionine (S)-S-oxide reductase MsrA [Micromonospora olivasterospora]|uniref:Peptide methionine sulfoxide reductase MsrA n=1 Tax=Micromonospora olivasterospora TaxID=1880 RepID=A0A562I8R4_MICOL|nr:peptide-methionine (S)-S-oxide reductase MsrA [Micromonospora olivasterospora]TWH67282.1 peptide-methionine (S)-S-oxide reductase [Micromonospora olivasterospora]